MKAVVLKRRGTADVLRAVNIPRPDTPILDEVLIHLKAAGVNYAEILTRRGIYGWVPAESQFVLGMEGAGIVEAIGPDVSDFSIGDPVIVGYQYGCQAEWTKVSQRYVFPAIDDYSFEENAAFTVSFLTAFVALREMARVRPKESLLIHAAAGGLGTAVVQLGKVLNLEIAGTASSSKKITFLKSRMDIDLASRYDSFQEEVIQWKPNGVDIIIESIGGKIFRESIVCLAPMGRIVVVGLSSVSFSKYKPWTWWTAYRTLPKVNILKMLGNSQGVMSFHLGQLLFKQYPRIKILFDELVELVKENSLRPVIDTVFPLESINEAHKRIENRQNIGKVILSID
ncbi:MAG: zinc-binding dehydrogenase [Candidatus Thorarchaeota archaeon]